MESIYLDRIAESQMSSDLDAIDARLACAFTSNETLRFPLLDPTLCARF